MRFCLCVVAVSVLVACGGSDRDEAAEEADVSTYVLDDSFPTEEDFLETDTLENALTSKHNGPKSKEDRCVISFEKLKASPEKICAGEQTLLTARVRPRKDFSGLLFITVTDKDNAVVFERFFVQSFKKGQTVTQTAAFLANAAHSGKEFRVRIRIFDAAFKEIARSGKVHFKVKSAEKCTQPPKPKPPPCDGKGHGKGKGKGHDKHDHGRDRDDEHHHGHGHH